MSYFLVYVTTSTEAEAKKIGNTVVGERLAACANIVPSLWSIYWWEGEVQNSGEAVLLIKTVDARLEQLIGRIKELHTYTCPCIVAIPITAGNPAFLQWIEQETQESKPH